MNKLKCKNIKKSFPKQKKNLNIYQKIKNFFILMFISCYKICLMKLLFINYSVEKNKSN